MKTVKERVYDALDLYMIESFTYNERYDIMTISARLMTVEELQDEPFPAVFFAVQDYIKERGIERDNKTEIR